MKSLIIQALDQAIAKLDRMTPSTKRATKSIDISDVKPIDLATFMKDNNVPDDADFDGVDNGYDGWSVGQTLLSWDVKVPTTDSDKLKFRKKRFTSVAFTAVHDLLISNGYVRRGYNTGLLKDFKDTTVYDMYVSKDFDRLVKYYSLPFQPQ